MLLSSLFGAGLTRWGWLLELAWEVIWAVVVFSSVSCFIVSFSGFVRPVCFIGSANVLQLDWLSGSGCLSKIFKISPVVLRSQCVFFVAGTHSCQVKNGKLRLFKFYFTRINLKKRKWYEIGVSKSSQHQVQKNNEYLLKKFVSVE